MTSAWTAEQPIVSIRDVYKSYGPVTVLNGVSMDVMKGEVICIIGPSGSGRSQVAIPARRHLLQNLSNALKNFATCAGAACIFISSGARVERNVRYKGICGC